MTFYTHLQIVFPFAGLSFAMPIRWVAISPAAFHKKKALGRLYNQMATGTIERQQSHLQVVEVTFQAFP